MFQVPLSVLILALSDFVKQYDATLCALLGFLQAFIRSRSTHPTDLIEVTLDSVLWITMPMSYSKNLSTQRLMRSLRFDVTATHFTFQLRYLQGLHRLTLNQPNT